MTIEALYHDLRATMRQRRLRRSIARLAMTLDPANHHERMIARAIAAWADGQDAGADRALGNAARWAQRPEGES